LAAANNSCSHDLPHVLDGVDDVAGARFALGADHGRALGDAPQSLTQVARAAHKRSGKGMLVHVVLFVRRGKHFGLVDVIDSQLLQDLRLGEVADAAFGHDRNRHHGHDFLDLQRRSHTRHAAFGTNHGRHALQCHHRGCPGFFGNFGLLGAHHVHDHAALQHLGQTGLQPQTGASIILRHKTCLPVCQYPLCKVDPRLRPKPLPASCLDSAWPSVGIWQLCPDGKASGTWPRLEHYYCSANRGPFAGHFR
jgi:hypothetical protein